MQYLMEAAFEAMSAGPSPTARVPDKVCVCVRALVHARVSMSVCPRASCFHLECVRLQIGMAVAKAADVTANVQAHFVGCKRVHCICGGGNAPSLKTVHAPRHARFSLRMTHAPLS